jgi:hypothetical protein
MVIAEANALAQRMVDEWAAIDCSELHPDALAALRALAYGIRVAVEEEWRIRDAG